MAHTANGLSVLALPRDLGQMRDISQSDSLLVFERLRQHFGVVVADAGGFNNPDFVAGLARTSQQNWIVTDQAWARWCRWPACCRNWSSCTWIGAAWA